MAKHNIELHQELYIEVASLYRETAPKLVPYIVVKVNVTNVHVVPKHRMEEYSTGDKLNFLRLRINSNTLKVMNSNMLATYKVWLEKERYDIEMLAIKEREELMQLAQARLERMTVEELKLVAHY